jgi:hypothetical protein
LGVPLAGKKGSMGMSDVRLAARCLIGGALCLVAYFAVVWGAAFIEEALKSQKLP